MFTLAWTGQGHQHRHLEGSLSTASRKQEDVFLLPSAHLGCLRPRHNLHCCLILKTQVSNLHCDVVGKAVFCSTGTLWMQAQVLADLPPVQLPANAPWKASMDGLSAHITTSSQETPVKFLFPDLKVVQHWLLQPFAE